MKKNYGALITMLVLIITFMSSCQVIGDIFKAGMWSMFIIIIVVVALIFWIISRFRK